MDRNVLSLLTYRLKFGSLSARRAWIEISSSLDDILAGVVALRKESVDRNFDAMQIVVVVVVALRKESVDRNRPVLVYLTFLFRRSPQGERG